VKHARLLRIAFWSWVAFVVAASLIPAGAAPHLPRFPISDKVGHFASYAMLTLLGMPLARGLRTHAFVWLAIVGLGGALEALQALVPGRAAEGGDLAADALGALAGAAVWVALRQASGARGRADRP